MGGSVLSNCLTSIPCAANSAASFRIASTSKSTRSFLMPSALAPSVDSASLTSPSGVLFIRSSYISHSFFSAAFFFGPQRFPSPNIFFFFPPSWSACNSFLASSISLISSRCRFSWSSGSGSSISVNSSDSTTQPTSRRRRGIFPR